MDGQGRVILVGAGPGDPDLITVRGANAIQNADVLIYDYLANPLLLDYTSEDCEKIYVGKKGGDHTATQDEINELIVAKAEAGNCVVRLKGGDPYLFGRGGEEVSVLNIHNVPFEVVPGIPAAVGMAAYAGIPLTDRRHCSQVTIVTGNEDPTKDESSVNWAEIAKFNGTIVVYMGVRNLPRIAQKLLDCGLNGTTPVSLVEWATTPNQRVVTGELETIGHLAEQNGVKAPALIVIGQVNDLRPELQWFESRPLFPKRILVTRSRAQASKLSEKLQELGAEVLEMPVIAIEESESVEELDKAVDELSTYDWVVFTSVNGIDAFMGRIAEAGLDSRAFADVHIATIGSATTERLADFGLNTDLQPPKFTGKTIYEELAKMEELQGRKLLLPRADIASPELRELCTEAGAEVTDLAAYRTVPADFDGDALRELIVAGQIDGVTFTSSSTVKFFVQGLGERFVQEYARQFAALSIGPVTSATLREFGIEPAIEAEQHDIPGLVAAIKNHFH